jgi:hypothetical protein
VCRSVDALRRTVVLLVLAALAAIARGAASTALRNYDLAEGDAAKTLRLFVEQSGEEVVYVVTKVRGVQTKAVRGEFAAREVLRRMLAGTGLVFVEDAPSGALMVSRENFSEPEATLPASPKAVKKKDALFPALLALLAAPSLSAQNPGSVVDKEEAVVLSPFTVTSELEKGYQATSTLAGTRLNTSVKDIGASISIYTKEFMDDLGANSLNDLLIYGTGMEAAGAQGNYSGVASDISATQVTGDGIRSNPQQTRTRGLATPSYTRGYFITSIPVDSYNTGAITNIRGPSATLFGTGSAGGVVDSSLVSAALRSNSNRIEFRFGNNSSVRTAINLNRVLVPGKFAFRLAALKDNEENNQRPSFEHKQRLYGAVIAKPFSPTTLRASFEAGGTSANRPLSVLPFNSIAPQWYAAGKPVFDWTFYDDPGRNPAAATQNSAQFVGNLLGQGQLFDQIALIYSRPNASSPDISFRGNLLNTGGTVVNAVRNSQLHPLVNRDLAADTAVFLNTRNVAELVAGAFPSGVIPPGLKMQGFTDFSTFDYRNRMLDETSRQMDAFHTFNVTLEQLAWNNRVGVEVAYNRERYDSRARNSFMQQANANHIRIDTTVTLPNGQPNPNLGRPYTQYGGGNWNNRFTEREAVRATAFLRYDFKEISPTAGKWLGRHVVTGLREITKTDSINNNLLLSVFGEAAGAVSPDPSVFSRRPGLIVYLGDSILNGKPLSLQPIQVPIITQGLTAQTAYFKAAAGSAAQGDFVTVPTELREIPLNSPAVRGVNKAKAAVLQSYWLRENLVTTFGWRRDAEYRYTQNLGFNTHPTTSTFGFKDYTLPKLPPQLAALETLSTSAVLRWPQNLVRLPAGIEASVFANTSQNFAPSGGRINAYGNQLAQQQGKTREWGVNLSFFNDRLFIRVNRFETLATDQSLGSGALTTAYNNGVFQHAQFWSQEQNTNPGIDRSADIETLFSTLPADIRALYQFKVVGSAAQQNLAATYSVPAGVTDTTDSKARGTEFELNFSPSRQWRFLLNVANQETVQANIAPVTRDFINRMMPAWEKLYDKPRNNYPGGFVLGNPLPATEITVKQWLFGPNGPLLPFATLIATEGVASAEQRKWRANLVGNYTFARESFLKGWNIGTGVRWQDKVGTGYPVSLNADGSVKIDKSNPYFSQPETNVDGFLGYTRKIWKNRIEWKVQLNVRNLIGQTGVIPITVQPTGEAAVVRLAPEKRWYLTNTFSF